MVEVIMRFVIQSVYADDDFEIADVQMQEMTVEGVETRFPRREEEGIASTRSFR
jgi:hypothetical protein